MSGAGAPGRRARARGDEHDDTPGVDAWMAALDHPLKPVVEGVRAVVLGAGDGITEGIKWKSPSFWLGGWFATVNVRGKQGVMLVLHLGAGVRADATVREAVADPKGLLTWHSADRASVSFADGAALRANRAALKDIVAAWAAYQRDAG